MLDVRGLSDRYKPTEIYHSNQFHRVLQGFELIVVANLLVRSCSSDNLICLTQQAAHLFIVKEPDFSTACPVYS